MKSDRGAADAWAGRDLRARAAADPGVILPPIAARMTSTKRLMLVLLVLLTGCGPGLTPAPGTETLTVSPPPTATPSATPTVTSTATATRTVTTTPTPSPTATPGPEAYYPRLILVDQDEQWVYVYEDGEQIRSVPCSTGKEGEETYTPAWEGEVGYYVGTFFSLGVYADEGWYLFDHYGGMLIHGAPYILEGDEKVYQELDALGVRPMSHGCIRLPPEEATWLTEWNPEGAHIIITPPPFEP